MIVLKLQRAHRRVQTEASPQPRIPGEEAKQGAEGARISWVIGAIAAVAAAVQAVFAVVQWQFSERTFRQQLELTKQAGDDAAKQTDRLIATAERLARSGEQSTSNSERAVRDSLEQGQRALDLTTASNLRTARLIKEAQEVFAAQSFPVIKIAGYEMEQMPGQLSCASPAVGLSVVFVNQSAIPIVTRSAAVNMSVNGHNLTPGGITSLSKKILTAKESSRVGIKGQVIMRAYSARKFDSDPPIVADVVIVYQALSTKRCYKYTSTVDLKVQCTLPDQVQWNTRSEDIVDIDCPT